MTPNTHTPTPTARLHEFTEEVNHRSHSSDSSKRYLATIKRKTSTLRASVRIDVRYPAIPPLWTLQPSSRHDTEDHSTVSPARTWAERYGTAEHLHGNAAGGGVASGGAPPLYDAALGRIEEGVNCMDREPFRDDVEETYDWIVVHQLGEIVAAWDELRQTVEAEVSKDGAGAENEGRRRRGRDRLPVGFDTYRNGL